LSFDVNKIREDFPILKQNLYSGQLVYFDNGATTQKPKSVIDIINEYYSKYNSNIHRGVHYLSEKMTQAYESDLLMLIAMLKLFSLRVLQKVLIL